VPLLSRRRLAVALLLGFAASAWLPTRPAAQAPGLAAKSRSLDVLFIGNSFTFFNNLPDMVAGIAKSLPAGPQIQPTMFASGGMTLQWFWAAGSAAAAIDSRPWSHVVLQEQSALGAGTEVGEGNLSPPGLFHQSVRNFVPRIRARGAVPVLLMTWARRSRPADQQLLTAAYDTIGHELGVEVSPAGVAWEEARRRWPDLVLHVADGSHPNPIGSYLTACVFYASITGKSPRGAAARITGRPYSRATQGADDTQAVTLADLESRLARRLQDLAWEVVSGRTTGKRP
jgi:hypothetical protein